MRTSEVSVGDSPVLIGHPGLFQKGNDNIPKSRVDYLYRSSVISIEEQLNILAESAGIDPAHRPDFKTTVSRNIEDFRTRGAARIISPPATEVPPVDLPLPIEPPERWRDRSERRETAPDFIRRVYQPWLGNGLTRADVRRLDPPLSMALENWLRRNTLPAELDLPTLKEQNTRWLERIERGEAMAVPGGTVDQSAFHLARRLEAVRRRRKSDSRDRE